MLDQSHPLLLRPIPVDVPSGECAPSDPGGERSLWPVLGLGLGDDQARSACILLFLTAAVKEITSALTRLCL